MPREKKAQTPENARVFNTILAKTLPVIQEENGGTLPQWAEGLNNYGGRIFRFIWPINPYSIEEALNHLARNRRNAGMALLKGEYPDSIAPKSAIVQAARLLCMYTHGNPEVVRAVVAGMKAKTKGAVSTATALSIV